MGLKPRCLPVQILIRPTFRPWIYIRFPILICTPTKKLSCAFTYIFFSYYITPLNAPLANFADAYFTLFNTPAVSKPFTL